MRSGARRHVMVVFGTRPEAIKMMPVVLALRADAAFRTTVVSTGQHRRMLDQVLEAFDATPPDEDLGVMEPGQGLPDLTARVLLGVGAVLRRERPDIVLVHGDTTTAMAAALAAFYAGVPVGHVEAGLRSHDLARPWPEEFNRVAVDALAALRFAPTEGAAANLAREYGAGRTVVTGNTGIDAVLRVAARLDADARLAAEVAAGFPFLRADRRLVLVTGHRRESFGDGFRRICDGLAGVAARGDVQVLYPVHLNPAVGDVVRGRLSGVPGVHLIEPVGYLEMVWLMRRAALLVTDSGGIQEEGPALGRPVLVIREVTERPEAIATGVVRLVGTDPALLRRAADALLDDPVAYARAARAVFPYGDGTAARRIVETLLEAFPR